MNISISKNKLITGIVIVLILIIGAGGFFFWKQKKKEKYYKDNIFVLADSVKYYKTQSGLISTEVKQLTLIKKELKSNIDSKDSLIQKLKWTIKDQNLNIKNLESILYATLYSEGVGSVPIYLDSSSLNNENENYDIKIAKIDDSFLNMNIYIYPDTLDYDYTYQEEITVSTVLIRKPTKKGKQAFILVRWLRPWTEVSTVTPSNKNSNIIISSKVNFKK
jgi:uncharacterized protein YneF (UPF0154 family)